jgi:hypothetical protein
MSCRIVAKSCKTAAETKRLGFDYAGFDQDAGVWAFLVDSWAPGKVYPNEQTIRPNLPTGFQYVSAGGQSGLTEPRWPTAVGGTVTDGSITWTAEAIGNESLRAAIISSAWSAPVDITVDSETVVNTGGAQIVAADVAGGDPGQTYDITNTVTLSDGTVEESVIVLSVE